MRGEVDPQLGLLTLITPEKRIPADHPIRRIKTLADEALKRLDPVFDEMYEGMGRPSIPPERLLKAQLLIALYSVRSERQFCERLNYDLLFRFFLDMSLDDEAWDQSTFAKNRDRLIQHEVARQFFEEVVRAAKAARLMSQEHFTVDGTLIEAWASLKSFRRKDEPPKDRRPPDDPGNPSVDFRGEKRSNKTHESTTDPESKLATKGNGQTAKLSYSGHILMENRNGLCVDVRIAPPSGYAERDEALEMIRRLRRRGFEPQTVGADKAYDVGDFPTRLTDLGIKPHIAVNQHRPPGSPVRRVARGRGYEVSQRVRKRVEEIFGWMKVIGGFRKTRYRGRAKTWSAAYLVAAAYNLLRIDRLFTLAEAA
jgi:transposase